MSALAVSQEPDQNWDDLVRFGDPLTLPAPFDLTIDTGEFPEA
ncbi:hypothetical protein [Streptomyces flaveolus]